MQEVECDAEPMSSVGLSRGRVVNGAAPSLRQPWLLAFSRASLDAEHRSTTSLHWNFPFERGMCPPAVKVVRLGAGSYLVIDLGECLLLTRLRPYSSPGVRWPNEAGDARTLTAVASR